MSNNLTPAQWNSLFLNINEGVCTPFLGAGASYPHIPLGSKIAKDWSDKHKYPLEDREYLPRVAQFLAIESGSAYPKRLMKDLCLKKADQFCDIHNLLADLPLTVYITTNYDNFMFNALKENNKEPRREFCRWNDDLKKKNIPLVLDEPEYKPSLNEPLVYHLHGYYEQPESMVLTEDDYIDFLVNLSKDPQLIPVRIQQALTEASLLFLGYGISDLNFRVLFRNLSTEYLKQNYAESHISVQMKPPNKNEEGQKNMVQQYLEKYFGQSRINMYWGSCDDFIRDFRQHFH